MKNALTLLFCAAALVAVCLLTGANRPPLESCPPHNTAAGRFYQIRADGTALLDINRADAARLAELPGIGEKLAARIVARREADGPFQTPRDLLKVSGIGEGKLSAIAELVTASAARP